MKRVIRTKGPTVLQMMNMAENLKEKYGVYSIIKTEARAYSGKTVENRYYLYIEDIFHHMDIPTWSELQDKYFKLIKIDIWKLCGL